MRKKLIILSMILIFISACGSDEEKIVVRNAVGEYHQDFRTNVAYLILEWNGKPLILASGYLVDRERGLFYTAKHFTDEFRPLGTDSCKVFFNGRVYTARLTKVPPVHDAAVLKISSGFNPEDFPEPISTRAVPKVGDSLRIRGFHPHSHWVRKENREEGFPDKEIQVLKDYYGHYTKDLNRETQVVFDDLGGKVVEPDPGGVSGDDAMNKRSRSFIKVLMTRDHKFSFGGLSGGLAVNDRDEAVGVITAEATFRFQFDERGSLFDPNGNLVGLALRQKYDVIYVTPLSVLSELERYIGEMR